MKNLFLVAVLFSAVSSAQATPSFYPVTRVYTRSVTCAQLQSVLESKGAAILYTGKYTYDRHVADGSQCMTGEITEFADAPTLDDASCNAGYVCRSDDK